MASRISRRRVFATAVAVGLGAPVTAAHARQGPSGVGGRSVNVRLATFNASMERSEEGELLQDLESGEDPGIRAVAGVVQTNNPDVLLINGFDHDGDERGIDLFRTNYLEVGHGGATPVDYPYAFTAPVNTEEAAGDHPGRGGMVILSRHPILSDEVRTFQHLSWQSMPGNLMPDESDMPLSSTSHWDVPIRIGTTTVHVLASHPTPPGSDDPGRRDERRHHDEIRLWAEYVRDGADVDWIVDDAGEEGGLPSGAPFVIMGDLGADPLDGDSWPDAVDQLLSHPRVQDTRPTSTEAVEAAEHDEAGADHDGDPALDTADLSEGPGNLRLDYVLPSIDLQVAASGVYWPASDDENASEHRLVRVDLQIDRF